MCIKSLLRLALGRRCTIADTKLSALTELAATPADGDELYIRDVSEAAANESKRITVANLVAAGVADPHGVGQHTDRTVTFHVPVSGALENSTLINSFNRPVIQVADGVDGHGVCGLLVPTDFVSFTRIDYVWVTGATSKVVRFDPQATFGASGEDVNGTTETPGDFDVTSNATTQYINVTNSTHTLGALAVGDYLGVRLRRLGAHANDTLADNLRFVGIDFVYVASQ